MTTSPTNLAQVFSAFATTPHARAPSVQRTRLRVVNEAMLAIRDRFDADPSILLPLVDGAELAFPHSQTKLFVRSPDAALVDAFLSSPQRGDPNSLSAVTEVCFGATRVVLGSDLLAGIPLSSPPSGWHGAMAIHPHLGAHLGLKIPHHGSPTAFHPDLMTPGSERAWWISPFNQGKRLPPIDAEGVPRLVTLNGAVAMTSTPQARARQPIHADPAVVTLAELPALFAVKEESQLPESAFAITQSEMGELDAVWCGAFDEGGAQRGSWRGTRAFQVVP